MAAVNFPKWAVVIPTNRPEKFQEFYDAWYGLFREHDVHVVIVEDSETKTNFKVENDKVTHLCWEDVPDYIPRRTDMIRSWGFYHLWREGLVDYVLTLDDDVKPEGDPFSAYELGFFGSVFSEYLSVGALTSSFLQMRGFPYKDRQVAEVAVQYGGWNGVLDFDAATQLAVPQSDHKFKELVIPVPKGAATTCCIMNAAFKIDFAPIMWQLTMTEGRYNRVGDIWSGLFIKKTLDAIGKVMLINGPAQVNHNRASDPYNSLQKEAPSVWLNDHLWENLPTPKTNDMLEAYSEVTAGAVKFFRKYDKDFATKFLQDRNAWLKLFKNA